jgi:hypothetical protein
MGEVIFGDLIEWWRTQDVAADASDDADELTSAMRELGVMESVESIVSKEVVFDWKQESEDFYTSLVSIDLSGADRVRTVRIIARAVITPPLLPIETRIEEWERRMARLREAGLVVPRWYLIWHGTIYADYPPHQLTDFITRFPLDPYDLTTLTTSLVTSLRALASLSLTPLSLIESLRTDGMRVFYCGLGFDLGSATLQDPEGLLQEYEAQILSSCSDAFRSSYLKSSQSDY